jgi:hypothetical protein
MAEAHEYDVEEFFKAYSTAKHLEGILARAIAELEPESMIQNKSSTGKRGKAEISWNFWAENIEYRTIEQFYNYVAQSFKPDMLNPDPPFAVIGDQFTQETLSLKSDDEFLTQLRVAGKRMQAMEVSYTASLINLGKMFLRLKKKEKSWASIGAECTGYSDDYVRKITNCVSVLYPYLDKIRCCTIPFAHIAFRANCLDEFFKTELVGNWWMKPTDGSLPQLIEIVEPELPEKKKKKQEVVAPDAPVQSQLLDDVVIESSLPMN